MRLKRHILFSTYEILRRAGYIAFKNRNLGFASVLMFHRVNNHGKDCLSTPTEVFDAMMRTLKERYHPISLECLLDRLERRESFEPATVVVTFDDGYRDNHAVAVPILEKYGIPATFFVTSGYIGTELRFPWDIESNEIHPLMDWDEVRDLAGRGFSIGAHTVTHADLGGIDLAVAEREVRQSRDDIENAIGRKATLFAYPFGHRDSMRNDVRQLIRDAGFRCCMAGFGGKVTVSTDIYDVPRDVVYQSVVELCMEIDNFMTYNDGKMRFHVL